MVRLVVRSLQILSSSDDDGIVNVCRGVQNSECLKCSDTMFSVQFALRDYRAEDFLRLWKLDQECFAPGIAYSKLELKTYIRRRNAFTLVAEGCGESKPGAIVGFLVAEAGRGGVGHIITIDVIAAARRSGVGSELLREAELRLRAAGSGSVALETAVDNHSALTFYKRHEYFLVKTVPRYYSNGLDAFVLKKDLAGPLSNPSVYNPAG
jgi:ribosomal-protein-alanine N-acetyltransferase